MIRNIISLILLAASVILSFKHGYDTFNYKNNPDMGKAMAHLGISESAIPFFGVVTILTGVLLLFPKTFFIGNLLNAVSIIIIMALAVRAGDYRMVFIEIPFLAMPLIMIALKYPFRTLNN